MTDDTLTTADYPLAENRPDLVRGARGKRLAEITLAGVLDGEVDMDDLRITPEALRLQADVARAAGREALARNFARAAEMTALPQPEIMAIYEILRPGRAAGKQVLLDEAARLRTERKAPLLAAFIEEAAEVYDRRGLFKVRY